MGTANDKNWYRLDNAAKIIPSSMVGADTRVFRLVCELKENVNPDILQQALDQALEEFPYMNCCLRKGIFWYYMEEMEHGGVVTEERLNALHTLYVPGRKNLLYRVNYYRKRIILEMFHALADGTGGFMFFEHIVANYLILAHHLDPSILGKDKSSVSEKQSDAFSQYYESDKRRKRNYLKEMFPVKAYQIKGNADPNLDEHLIEGTVSVKKILSIAHSFHVTLGILATSIWVEAIVKQMKHSEYSQPVVVSVPVNLRQYFHSATTRNFFGVIQVSYDPHKYDGSLESVMGEVEKEFHEQLKEDKIRATMNSYSSLEHNLAVKVVPLVFKDLGLMAITQQMNRGVTTSVSNVGKVNLAPELVPYINKFCSFMACKTVFMCISTFQDKMVFGISSCFETHATEMNFFRRLVELGADVEIASNDYDREEA